MDRRVALLFAALAIVATMIALWFVVPSSRTARIVDIADAAAPPKPAALDADLAIAPRTSAEPRAEASPTETAPAPAATPANRIAEGTVVDLLAAPVPDVAVVFEPSEHDDTWTGARVKSDPAGRFQLEVPNRRGSLRTVPGSWSSVFEPRIEASGPASGCLLVVARTHPITGHVVDEQDAPLAGAQVRFELPGSTSWISKEGRSFRPDNETRSSFPLDLGGSNTARWIVTSDARGAYAIPDAPNASGARLVTLLDGYATNFRSPYSDTPDVLIRLRRPVAPKNHVRGRVVDSKGTPVPRAFVFFGLWGSSTDDAGKFDLDVGDHAESAPLVAVKDGWLPVSQPCLAQSPYDVGAWPDPLVLVLRERALVIRGQVVDAAGQPLPKCRVLAIDPVNIDEALRYKSIDFPGGVSHKDVVIGGSEVPAGADGTFELTGLLPRSYRLRAVDLASLASVDTEPIEAGRTDVVIRVALGETHPCVAGLVVDPAGHPVAGIRVQTGRLVSDRVRWCDEVRTDGEGRFKFSAVSREADQLVVLPDLGAAHGFSFADLPDLCAMRLVVPRMGDLRVELTNTELGAREFAVLDRQGKRMQLGMHWGGGGWTGPMDAIRIQGTQSGWAIVPEDAATIILLKDGTEVARQAVEVKPGALNVVRM